MAEGKKTRGFGFYFVHPDAYVGERCTIWNAAQVNEGCRIGDDCVIGSCVYIGHRTKVGNGCRFNHGTFIPNRSVIGNNVFFGPGVICCDDKHPRAGNKHYVAQPPVIEDNVSIGAGAIILPGVRIGRGAVIGAGAVVTQDVLAGETRVGLPARLFAPALVEQEED